jgi:hypothetical protein
MKSTRRFRSFDEAWFLLLLFLPISLLLAGSMTVAVVGV